MQCVILAAGKGSRMRGLNGDVPKPLLSVGGKTLLQQKLDILPDDVDEVIIVVGYLGQKIREALGDSYRGKRLQYVEQDVLDGTAGALWRAKGMLKGSFFVMMGDDIYAPEDLEACRAHEWAHLVSRVENTDGVGKVLLNESGAIEDIVESGGHEGGAGIAGTNMFFLDTRIFDFPLVRKAPNSDEYGLPQTIIAASKHSGIPLRPVTATFWSAVNTPEDLVRAEEMLADRSSA
ncbi:hypothetical protein COU20_02985 [Candidatus Kaiserbacteria bacterium CG10_big_fil_rev_8_21_14_0_10_59_10]|uniref:Nucleotidyl transferase domain-containing protein n=1 Tax=Candidatus Kaiserbacteria bacterium CG10_big_fil_rev_8_21_14_0_10_59_10 TaxID=1974612 RepID=A0A2H0U7B1_9BACT|nr:MAG: hypothetical protein COU20_02985 [Candidatus Kaiserbacteria bacterium CG10_big_fil_rev_8_21_14_0_10_59_10]